MSNNKPSPVRKYAAALSLTYKRVQADSWREMPARRRTIRSEQIEQVDPRSDSCNRREDWASVTNQIPRDTNAAQDRRSVRHADHRVFLRIDDLLL